MVVADRQIVVLLHLGHLKQRAKKGEEVSLTNLKEYARRCATEPEMRHSARELGLEDIDEHIRISESLGLEWDVKDLMALRKELVDGDDLDELSQEELEQVAGGILTTTAALAAVIIAGAVAGGAVAGGAVGAAVGGGASAAGDGGW